MQRDTKAERQLGLKPVDPLWNKGGKNSGRIYAAPDTINGKAYIAAYVRLNNVTARGELESLGVVVQEEFNNGLFTTLIPVDRINDVAAISGVSRVNVSPLRKIKTNIARQKTNVDDVLTLSTDAISEGLSKKYDGSGVVLGVIDTGIDFQHIAFKDKNGNYRLKRAYVYNGSSGQEYTSFSSSSPTTDDSSEDHGTHTSSTAGGSSVIISGSNVTVTDDHANATYGGMAPGADLYLAGVNGLSDTYLSNAVKKIVQYADNNNQPVVVSNSWGSQLGPHDGTGDIADVYNSLFGDNHPNHIALFAASNDGGKSKDNEGGGYHISGTASSSNPLSTILRSATYTNTDGGYFYKGIIASAWARSTNVSKLGIKIHVLDTSTGNVLKSVTMTTQGSVSGLSTFYSGTLYVYYDQVESDKTQVLLYSSQGITSQSVTSKTMNGEKYYVSKYTLAIQVYPTSGTSLVDIWGGTYGYFTNHLTTNGYAWKAGSDDMSVSDEATMPNVISIGAYVTKNSVTDYKGTTHSLSSSFPNVGDIAYFSSYATATESPTGIQYPWITAPGATIVSAVNHYDKSGEMSYINDNSTEYDMYRVNSNTTSPYGSMEGTSMATPTAAGIVALWLQAAKEAGKEMTVNDIKNVMRETAINDSYTTTGSNASHFGNGKIDALAGIKYILGASASPTIKAEPTELAFEGFATQTYTKTVTVTGLNLEGNITVAKSGSNVFTVDKTSIASANAANGVELTVTWKPTAAGTQTGTITLRSNGAEDVSISLTGTAEAATPTILTDQSEMEFTAKTNSEVSKTLSVYGRFLTGNITATLNDAEGVFSLSKTSFTAAQVLEGTSLDVKFQAAEEGNYTATITFTGNGAEALTVNLSATASDGGTASDTYLDIAKYATIDEEGWNSTYVNNLYQYTEYPDDEVAWLTLPIYGAWSSIYYSPFAQNWIKSNVADNNNKYAGATWNSNDKLLGSSPYFTSSSARAMGYNYRYNYTQETVTFYVTNTTGVKMLGLGQTRANSSYPATLKIYECTVNADGSLTAASNTVKSESNSATSGTFVLTAAGLDPSKIYKVETGTYRSYICEVGFQTPIVVEKNPELAATPTALSFESPLGQEQTQSFTVTGKNLKDKVTIALDNNEDFEVTLNEISIANAEAGQNVTVSYNPTTMGTKTGTITLSSADVAPVTISLSANALKPELVADPETLTFDEIEAESTTTKSFSILGVNLSGNVTATLTDANNVFSIDETDISIDEALEGTTITVTFSPQQQGTYTGTVTLSSQYADDVVVALNATAKKKTPDYFDVNISSVGVTTLYLDFPVEIPYDTYDPDLLGVYYIYKIEDGQVKYARLSQYIPENTGVVIHGNQGTYRFPKALGQVTPLKYENKMTGSTETISVAKALENASPSSIVMTLGRGTNSYIGFYKYSGKTLAANKAFIIWENTTESAKGFVMNFDNESTGINAIGVEGEDDKWYTIQGLPLNGKPSQPGLYIKKGKTITIK